MDENTPETGDARYVFVKLTNGDSIMCTTFENIDKLQNVTFLEVIDPVQIFSFKIPQNGSILEKYIMQSWAPFSSSTTSFIPINNIVFVGDLKEFFIERYIDYITDPSAQQLLEETDAGQMGAGDNSILDDDGDDETLEEVVEEIINKNENTKKWYH